MQSGTNAEIAFHIVGDDEMWFYASSKKPDLTARTKL